MFELALDNQMVASSLFELEREELFDIDGGKWYVDAMVAITAVSTVAGAACGVAAVLCPPLALGFAVAGLIYACDAAASATAAYCMSK